MNMKFASLLTLALAAGTLSAHAATEVTFTGTAAGFFSTSAGAASGTTTDGALTYVGSSFTGTTVGDFIAFSQAANDFGSFTNSGLGGGTNEFFTLVLTFTAPAGVSGNPQSFQATMVGSVQMVGGTAQFIYAPNTSTFTYTGQGGGTGTLRVDNIAIAAGNTIQESGSITATPNAAPSPTPEPSSLLLLGTGLLGVAGAARRRFNK